jgi:poly(A) polymerase
MDQRELAAICADLDPLVTRFAAAGHRLYLVGGVVRDLLLHSRTTGDDVDLTTDALPAVTRSLVAKEATALWTQGERFGTIGAHVNGRPVEITTHRAESYHPASRKPEVVFGTDLTVDLSRRDFTVNAMAIELPSGEFVDPFGGRVDLERRRLCTPLDPELSFTDDPLRMLRAARFVARFGLEPDPVLVAVATRLAARLSIVSVERIHDETERLLATSDPSTGLELLERTGLLEQWIPEVVAAGGAVDARFGPMTRWEVVRAALVASGSPTVRRALLAWPVAEADGERAVVTMTRRLRYSVDDQRRTGRLSGAIRRALASELAPPEQVRRFGAELGPDVDPVLAALDALAGLLADRSLRDRLEALRRVHHELDARGELGRLEPPLGGADVMAHLGCGPGPEVGRALDALREAVLVEGPLDRDQALVRLDRWWRERSG